MKRLILAVGLFTISGAVLADQYINPYVRKDGTYVEGHYRSAPNSTKFDNYSTEGNINPYTGQKGYEDPFKTPELPSIYDAPRQPRRRY